MERPQFLDLGYDDVHARLAEAGSLLDGPRLPEQAFRAVHQQLLGAPWDAQRLAPRKAARLKQLFAYQAPGLASHVCAEDGSQKFAWRLADGAIVESVLIPRHGRWSLCVSSQAGCPLACVFCATGKLGLLRDLDVHEIVGQVLEASRLSGHRIRDLVFMGMGEPLLNDRAVIAACGILAERFGLQISRRRMVISTAGVVPAIRRFADQGHRMKLVFSLGSAVPEKRAVLMPIQKRWGFGEFLDAVRHYSRSIGGKHVTLEYIAIHGLTLGDDDIDALREHLTGFRFILNVIPLNPVDGTLEAPTRAEVQAWTDRLRPLGFPVKVRHSFGRSGLAGCGQLGAGLLLRG